MQDMAKVKVGDIIQTCGHYYKHDLVGVCKEIESINTFNDNNIKVDFFPKQDFGQYTAEEMIDANVYTGNYIVIAELTGLDKVIYGIE
jgi:hypothetical protein